VPTVASHPLRPVRRA